MRNRSDNPNHLIGGLNQMSSGLMLPNTIVNANTVS